MSVSEECIHCSTLHWFSSVQLISRWFCSIKPLKVFEKTRQEPSACCERLANLLRWCRVALMGRDLPSAKLWSSHHLHLFDPFCIQFLKFGPKETESRVAMGSFGPTLKANHGIVQVEKKDAWYDEWICMDMHCDALHCYWCNCVLTLYRHRCFLGCALISIQDLWWKAGG